jgi:hypothetical protein
LNNLISPVDETIGENNEIITNTPLLYGGDQNTGQQRRINNKGLKFSARISHDSEISISKIRLRIYF